MDNDYPINLDEILRTIETADVITVRFLLIEKRLLIDNRVNEIDGPMARLVARVSSSEERFRSIRRLRPRFPLPEKLTSIWWPKYISTLETSGVWPALVRRMAESGFPNAVRQCEDVLRELKEMERKEIMGAIPGGEGYQTLWQASHSTL
ncbi:MAG TPA: hypothetical protein VNN10_00015 [Dehalococcoidia bacterium]|nr:hypothetical protein [Dehalococcoidia bacterium]